MSTLAVFGGSFDPVQNGHLTLIRALSERFESTLVVPCRISPFKTLADIASADDRIRMLEIALESIPNVSVSRLETDATGISFTYRTVQTLQRLYPTAKISLAIGADMLPRLREWKEAEFLRTNVDFFVTEREGFETEHWLRGLRAEGYSIRTSGICIPDDSSTVVKVDLAFGKKPTVPDDVLRYISDRGLYRKYSAYTDRYPEFCMKQERIEHTYRAVKTGIYLAKLHDADIEKTVVALLLHDIGKYADAELLAKYNLSIDTDIAKLPLPVRHAPIGAMIAARCFGVEDEEILNAIREHTTGKPGMSRLSEVVYLADCIEPGRTYPGVDGLRRLARDNLDAAMTAALMGVIQYAGSSGNELAPETAETYKYFEKRIRGTK